MFSYLVEPSVAFGPAMDLSWRAIVAATLAAMVIGSLWYSPLLFGNVWMKLQGIDPSKQKALMPMWCYFLIQVMISALLATTLNILWNYLDWSGVLQGMQMAKFAWVFFVLMTATDTLWSGKPWKLWLLHAGEGLVSFMVMGALIGYLA